MIRLADHVEHDGARTEVERDARAYVETPVAVQAELAHAPLLDVVHTNRGADRPAFRDRGIAEKTTLRHDGRQSVHVNNVVDLRISRRRHVTTSPLRKASSHPRPDSLPGLAGRLPRQHQPRAPSDLGRPRPPRLRMVGGRRFAKTRQRFRSDIRAFLWHQRQGLVEEFVLSRSSSAPAGAGAIHKMQCTARHPQGQALSRCCAAFPRRAGEAALHGATRSPIEPRTVYYPQHAGPRR